MALNIPGGLVRVASIRPGGVHRMASTIPGRVDRMSTTITGELKVYDNDYALSHRNKSKSWLLII